MYMYKVKMVSQTLAKAIHIDDVCRYIKETITTYVLTSPPITSEDFQTLEESLSYHIWFKNNFNKWYGKTFTSYQLGEMNCYLKQVDPMNYEPTDDMEKLVNNAIFEWMLTDNRILYYGITSKHIHAQIQLHFQ